MTSTIFSNKKKNSFLSLLLHTLDKNSTVTVVYVCVLVFLLPIILWANQTVGNGKIINFCMFTDIFSFAVPLVSILFSVIIGVSVFAGYHNKRSTDLYASLPASKICLFLSSYIGGALIVVVPLILTTVVSGFIGWELSSFGYIMEKLFVVIPPILASYTMVAFLSVCCGTRIDTVVSFIAINALYPVLVYTISYFSASMDPGCSYPIYGETYNMFTVLGTAFSPALNACILGSYITQGAMDVLTTNNHYSVFRELGEFIAYHAPNVILFVIYWCVFIAVVITASIILAKFRRNENVQNGFIYSLPKHIITVLASACGGLFLGMVCVSDVSNMDSSKEFGTFVLWAILGSIVTYAIASLIYNRSVMRMLKSLPLLVLPCFIAVGVYFSFAVDLFGNASYVPNAENVKSVQITAPVGDFGSQHYYGYEGNSFVTLMNDDNKSYQKDVALSEKENIENVVAMHKSIVDNIHDYIGNMYSMKSGNSGYLWDSIYDPTYRVDDNGDFIIGWVQITYYMKNGDTIQKSYYTNVYDDSKICDYMSKIVNSTEYKEKAFYLTDLINNPNSASIIIDNPLNGGYEYNADTGEIITEEGDVVTFKEISNTELFTGLAEALEKDFMSDDIFETAKVYHSQGSDLCSGIDIHVNGKAYYDEYYLSGGESTDDVWHYVVTIPIPKERYTNTWNYINSHTEIKQEIKQDNITHCQIRTENTIYGEHNPFNNN